MNTDQQSQKAQTLLALHSNGKMLVLPNVWNPIGARVLERKGYPAVATASAAISASLGYRDGENLLRSTMIDVVGRIARSVNVPVTADIEAGYADSLAALRETTEMAIESGVVGVNLEDSLRGEGALRAIDEQCARIAAMREAASRKGVHLVINARVDSFLSPSFTTTEDAIDEAAIRAKAYAGAGADCIYPIGPGDAETVRALRDRIESPINILASPTAAPLNQLREIGVNRVSFGAFVFRACLRAFVDTVDSVAAGGGYDCLAGMMTSGEAGNFLREGREEDHG